MPYCRRCGTLLQENARFCHKCGTEVVVFYPAQPVARPTQKKSVLIPILIVVAVVAVAAVMLIAVYLSTYPNNFSQTQPSNQTNINKLSFNLQQGNAHIAVLSQNSDKTGFAPVFAASPPINPVLLSS